MHKATGRVVINVTFPIGGAFVSRCTRLDVGLRLLRSCETVGVCRQ